MIQDIYDSGHSMMAKFVDQGLAFTSSIEEEFKTENHKLVAVKVGNNLENGGLLYPDVSSYTNVSKAYFVTLPSGEIEVDELD
jgi:hypothetical protein